MTWMDRPEEKKTRTRNSQYADTSGMREDNSRRGEPP